MTSEQTSRRRGSVLIDLGPLRSSPVFRRYWIGRSVSVFGAQMTIVAVLYQIWEVTHSAAWTGAVGLTHAIGMIALSPLAGQFADRHDRRRIQLVSTTGQTAVSAALAAQALLGGAPVMALLGLLLVQTCFGAFGGPASRTVIPRLLPADQVAAGLALQGISFQASMLVGPALGGVVIGWVGIIGCYLVDLLTFTASFVGILGLPRLRPIGEPPRAGWSGIAEGFEFLWRHRVLRGLLLTDLAATVLVMPVSLFPLLNAERFDGDPRTLGLFLTAIGVGGVLSSVLSGTYTRSARQHLFVVGGALTWALSLGALGLVTSGIASVALLVVAGAADTASVVSRGALVQRLTPDALRGRVAATELLVGMTGPDLGNARGGLLASWVGARAALLIGGLSSAVVVLGLVRVVPELGRSATPISPDGRELAE